MLRKLIFLGLLFFVFSLSAQISEKALWIGAISHEDAALPRNIVYSYLKFKTDEYKRTWSNTDTLSKRSIQLRREFSIDKKIKKAELNICGLGHYEAVINGSKVSEDMFAPLWSDYAKTVYYNKYDVTDLLISGENTVAVLLGNGMYNEQGGRYTKFKLSYGAPTLIASLKISFFDGSFQELNSDENWKYLPSPITFNSMFGGEDYDARLESTDWTNSIFDDTHWRKVVVQTAPAGKLQLQTAPAVKIMERYDFAIVKQLNQREIDSASVKSKRKLHPETFVFDMGQNLSGFPEITVNGQKGDTVTLVVAETLTLEGAANQRESGRPHIYTYVLKGGGDETWHPRFSYYGFRYIQVEGVSWRKKSDKLPELKKIQSCFVYNQAALAGSFSCSNSMFNQVHKLIVAAMKSNMQGVLTDCPQREKLGWLEQVHLNGPGLMYNFNLKEYLPKIMQDMADAQQSNGMVPTIAPLYTKFGTDSTFDNFGDSPEWGSALNITPWMYQCFYDDKSLLENYYPQMKAYVEYLGTKAKNNILDFGLGDWYDYPGNVKAGFSVNTPIALVATAHFFYDAELLSKLALQLGNKKDAEKYGRLADQIKSTFNATFYDKYRKRYAEGSQTAMAVPLFFNMIPEKDKWVVLHNLVSDIAQKNYRLTTGDIGNRYLFRVLADNDLNDIMYKMHNHYDIPGYGYQVKAGATTLTEQWNPKFGSSMNHFMLGQIEEWFYRSLAGIQPSETGYKNFVIKPELVEGINWVNAKTNSVYGEISVNWKRIDGEFSIDIEIPQNAAAELYLPDGKVLNIKSGKHHFQTKIIE